MTNKTILLFLITIFINLILCHSADGCKDLQGKWAGYKTVEFG